MRTRRRKIPRVSVEPKVQRGWLIFDWVVIVVVFVLFVVGTVAMIAKPRKYHTPNVRAPEPGKSVVLQLINGSGRPRAEITVADAIRQSGVDVRDMVKSEFIYPFTLLLCRDGDMTVAESLASMFGLSRSKVLLQRSDVYVDATLVLGLDFNEALSKLQAE